MNKNVEETKQIPQFINNRIDIKAITIDSMNKAIENIKSGKITGLSLSPQSSLSIITNFGIIQGELIELNYEDGEPLDNRAIWSMVLDARDMSLSDLENEIGSESVDLVNNSSVISIKNAKIIPFANPTAIFNVAELFIFSDQVVGMTGSASVR